MKLIDEVVRALGGDTLRAITVIPGFGAYVKSVKGVAEYTPAKITLAQKNAAIILSGENLCIGRYFEEDVFVSGKVKSVEIC